MSDDVVRSLLAAWGVPQLVSRLREEEVDEAALRALPEDLVAELVPRIGPRALFLRGWRSWKRAAPGPGADTSGHCPDTPGTDTPGPDTPRSDTPSIASPTESSHTQRDTHDVLHPNQGVVIAHNDGPVRTGSTSSARGDRTQVWDVVLVKQEQLEMNDPKDLNAGNEITIEECNFFKEVSSDPPEDVPVAVPLLANYQAPPSLDLAGLQFTTAKRSRNENYELESVLRSSTKGRMLLAFFHQRGALDSSSRQTLADLIIAEELREDLAKRITSQRFQEIAAAIVDLFPGENQDTYFSYDRSTGARPMGKGKLASKYYNMRRQLNRSGALLGRRHQVRDQRAGPCLAFLQMTPDEEAVERECEEYVRMILGDVTDPTDLRTRWRRCWRSRMTLVLGANHSPAAYLERYPVLYSALGDRLLKDDYEALFKKSCFRAAPPSWSIGYGSAGNFPMKPSWDNLASAARTITEERTRGTPGAKARTRTYDTDAKMVEALLMLPGLLPVTTGKGPDGELWRPTRQEAQEAFLLHAQDEQLLQQALSTFWARMSGLGQPVCPLAAVVEGSAGQEPRARVVLDSRTSFPANDVVDALDGAFKMFHALQVPYPPQAQAVWLFVQHALYGVASPQDRMSVSVSALLADFGVRPIPSVRSWDELFAPAEHPDTAMAAMGVGR